jgi:hypothetical protein
VFKDGGHFRDKMRKYPKHKMNELAIRKTKIQKPT